MEFQQQNIKITFLTTIHMTSHKDEKSIVSFIPDIPKVKYYLIGTHQN